MSSPRVTVRQGHLLVHCDPGSLPAVLDSLASSGSVEGDANSLLSVLAEASSSVLSAAALRSPDARLRGLRDVIFLNRGVLDAGDLRLLREINTAYGLLRHRGLSDIVASTLRITSKLGLAQPLTHDAVDHVFLNDPWAAAADLHTSSSTSAAPFVSSDEDLCGGHLPHGQGSEPPSGVGGPSTTSSVLRAACIGCETANARIDFFEAKIWHLSEALHEQPVLGIDPTCFQGRGGPQCDQKAVWSRTDLHPESVANALDHVEPLSTEVVLAGEVLAKSGPIWRGLVDRLLRVFAHKKPGELLMGFRGSCLRGHQLQRFSAAPGGWPCDLCEAQSATKSCEQCVFVLCEECFVNGGCYSDCDSDSDDGDEGVDEVGGAQLDMELDNDSNLDDRSRESESESEYGSESDNKAIGLKWSHFVEQLMQAILLRDLVPGQERFQSLGDLVADLQACGEVSGD
jgi:hypothetical protein